MVVVTLRRTKEEPKQRLLRLFPVTSDGRSVTVAQAGKEQH
ncbi:MAG TPA: hypothetical protein VIG38_06875 [Hyphomicrobium sp.]|jgi:hypothetical protein